MARQSPMRRLHQQAEASLLPYGPAEGGVQLVESFGELEMEYAALRKHCVLLDQPQRGLIEIAGKDRLDFLNRMVTQELKGMGPFRVRRGFWLNKLGRIDADLRIIDLPSRTLLEVDVLAAARAAEGLAKFVVAEDVTIADRGEQYHRLALHGPTGLHLLTMLGQSAAGANASGPGFEELLPDRACVVRIGDAEVIVFREDSAGEMGLEFIVPADKALAVYQQLLEAGHEHEQAEGEPVAPHRWRSVASRVKLRPAGWHAYNIARIEAGTPLYHIDFGPQSLPAETGIIADRVSFTKGCYLGQEIVARMHSRGHPKQVLVALKFDVRPDEATGLPVQPVTGTRLTPEADATEIGGITSSTLSPMLRSAPIALAQVRYAHANAGTVLRANVGAEPLRAVVQPSLVSWVRGSAARF